MPTPPAQQFATVDITDRFDFTFLCGDLNFRLDITRLHADWLISQRGLYFICASSWHMSDRYFLQRLGKP